MNTDPPILCFGNCSLRQSDIEALRPPQWITDSMIAFFMEYLDSLYNNHKELFIFIPPSVVQHLRFATAEEVEETIKSLSLRGKNFIFMPVNDSPAQLKPGGSHWSLLIYKAKDNVFQHYDSMTGSNFAVAQSLTKVLSSCIPNSRIGIEDMACLQQVNGYDCGLHVLYNAHGLAQTFAGGDDTPGSNQIFKDIGNFREGLKTLIYSLKK